MTRARVWREIWVALAAGFLAGVVALAVLQGSRVPDEPVPTAFPDGGGGGP